MKRSKGVYLSLAAICLFAVSVNADHIGIFHGNMDIDAGTGNLGAAGSAEWDPVTGTYTIEGSGHDIWNEQDNFHFVYKPWSGDFFFSAFVSVEHGTSTNDWVKSVLMAREDLTAGSPNVATRLRPGPIDNPDGQYSLQWRTDADIASVGSTEANRVTGQNPGWHALERVGNTFNCYYGDENGNWVLVDSADVHLKKSLLLGLGVTAHEVGSLGIGTFSSVSISRPLQAGGEIITFQQGVGGYEGSQDAHIISWDGAANQLGRDEDGSNEGDEIPQNTGAHTFIEEGDYGGGSNDSKVILIEFDTSSIDAEQASHVRSAQLGLYFVYERNAGGTASGPGDVNAGHRNPHLLHTQQILKDWAEGEGGGPDNGDVDGADTPDNSGGVTWNSTGIELWEAIGAEGPTDVGPVESITYFDPFPGQWIWLDVTNMAREWVANPDSNHGVKVSQETDNDPTNAPTVYPQGAHNFASKENENIGNRPKLVIELTDSSNVGAEWSLYE